MTGPRTVKVRDLVGNAEVRAMCGGITRHTLISWRKTQGFPKPIRRLSGCEIWDASEVRHWLSLRDIPDQR